VERGAELARLSPRVKRAQFDWRATVTLGCPRCRNKAGLKNGSFCCNNTLNFKNTLSGAEKIVNIHSTPHAFIDYWHQLFLKINFVFLRKDIYN
jgi:hypothetical protein